MVLLIATDRILAALEAVPAARREELDLPSSLDLYGPIAHSQLLRLSKHLQNDAEYNSTDRGRSMNGPTILSALLRGTKVYVPPPPKKPEPSPEYLAEKARLQALAERQAYQRLLNPAYTPNPDHADPYATKADGTPYSEDTLTPSLVLNIFLSTIITGAAVYWCLTSFGMPRILASIFSAMTGPAPGDGMEARDAVGASEAVRVLLSFFAALSVAVAESVLYAVYLGKVVEARNKERKLKEKKVVIGPVEGDGDLDEGVIVGEGEKEEIWGKGVNGGVRRRMREKWEREQDQTQD
ncbi:hypothetical protein N7513_012637 [Penicillium frequentans]|uniref:Endoplasmic reticulum-based factor for assembly of V-ATPase-domain-containing protein n=1 Tax=Penicillium frequentans TaxID=3151616 RepID=A0AAD6D1Z1_9EURO|nr:hypothetical protein N7513_012637 [Penicillium glabrum]KAJ5552168.1 hypothetical protein N7494_001546 [Penicillium glabrum]